MYEEFVSERLSQLRIAKGVSARDMSLSLGQNVNYINQIENQKALPAMQNFFFICEYLGVTPMEFFDSGNAHPVRLRSLMEELKRLDEKALFHIAGLVEALQK